jgi:hypothetical protein
MALSTGGTDAALGSYVDEDGLKANYEAIRQAEGLSWQQFAPEVIKAAPADSPLARWAAAQARAEADDSTPPRARKAPAPTEKG